MDRNKSLSESQYRELMEFIIKLLMHNGIKSTTMDAVASELHISKRTLYEIFSNKEEMVDQALKFFHEKVRSELSSIFNTSENVMEAILRCFLYNRDMMSRVCVAFVRDVNEYHSNCLHPNRDQEDLYFYEVLQKGVDEGYFYDDLNLKVQCRMLGIQMESLKRMEELFPPDITLLEAFDNISLGFLRGICNDKGRKELEKVKTLLKQN